ncbi:MAG: DNA recombination protein RmuC [Frankia sp.]
MDSTTVLLLLIGLALGAAGGAAAIRRADEPRLRALAAERDSARRAADAAVERANLSDADAAGLRTALDYEKRAAGERVALVERSQDALNDSFRALSAHALEGASRQFLELAETRMREAGAHSAGELDARREAIAGLVGPLNEALGRMEARLREMEGARGEAHASLLEQVRASREASDALRGETAALVTALRRPQARGAWGEMHLRRVVEISGMVDRCDFTEQASVAGVDGTQRPDMVVHLAGGKNVVVDAKVPLAAFLDAHEATDDAVRRQRLTAHARHLRVHVDALASKAYWRRWEPTPEFVVLFVPAEAFLAPALDADPTLLEHAATRKVVIATPTTLIALLRTVAYAWTQDALTDRTREVFELGRDLYTRLGTMGEHVDRLGRSLGRAVADYNATVGSLESRVLVPARRLAAMKVVETELPTPASIETGVRPVASPELFTDQPDHLAPDDRPVDFPPPPAAVSG